MIGTSKNETGKENIITTTFARTPTMSTYLVAFVVSDYKSVKKNSTFNVWTKPQAIESAKYALEIGQPILTELEEFTGIKYYGEAGQKMTKMDQISIPDFVAGAMENWGLVTYR